MASAKKCDRCGCLYENINASEYDPNKEFWKYSIIKDYHPYPEEKLDLCLSCWKKLYIWLVEGKNGC